jgi:hypothetical protein
MSTRVIGGRLWSIGQLTYSGAHQPTLDRGFATIPYLQFGQDAAHVVGHRLATQEQPSRNLGVRQPLREQPEHVLLAGGEDPDASAAGPRRDAKSPQERRDAISVKGGTELLVRRLGATRVFGGKIRSLTSGNRRQRNVNLRPLVRESQVSPRGQRVFQDCGCRFVVTGRGGYQTTPSQRARHSPSISGRLGQPFEPDRGGLSRDEISGSQPSLDKQSQPGSQQHLVADEHLQPLLEQARRPGSIALSQP